MTSRSTLPKIVSVALSEKGVRAMRRMHSRPVLSMDTLTLRNGSESGAVWFTVDGVRFVWNRKDKLVRAWVKR